MNSSTRWHITVSALPGASKSVSDALRSEVAHGRVIRSRRGRYRPACMPRSAEYRILKRVRALHDEVAEMSLRGGHEGCGQDFPAA
jgi:hypothetical protein